MICRGMENREGWVGNYLISLYDFSVKVNFTHIVNVKLVRLSEFNFYHCKKRRG